jgi:two-component system cell cycle sensor histidine kinase/response regulator CckA
MNVEIAGGTDTQPRMTVLVVEDEALIRWLLSDYLIGCGYCVIEAGSGDEAIEVLRETRVMVNVVVSDVMMPGATDGFALALWARKKRPEIKVILTSAIAKFTDAADASTFEGTIIPKPYDPAKLERRIKALLAA